MTRELSAIMRLFDRVRGVTVRQVAGGRPLYRVGDPADALYLVRAGGFAVFRPVAGAPAFARPAPLGRWFWSGAWRRGPPIVSILMRSATLATGPDLAASRPAADLYVMPEVGGIEIRNWRAYDRAVAAGRDAMRVALDRLDTPVPLLRRHHMAQAAASPM